MTRSSSSLINQRTENTRFAQIASLLAAVSDQDLSWRAAMLRLSNELNARTATIALLDQAPASTSASTALPLLIDDHFHANWSERFGAQLFATCNVAGAKVVLQLVADPAQVHAGQFSDQTIAIGFCCCGAFWCLILDGFKRNSGATHLVANYKPIVRILEQGANAIQAASNARAAFILDLLDSCGAAAFALNDSGQIIAMNRPAAQLQGPAQHAVVSASLSDLASPLGLLSALQPGAPARVGQQIVEGPNKQRLLVYAVHGSEGKPPPFAIPHNIVVALQVAGKVELQAADYPDAVHNFRNILKDAFGLTRTESSLAYSLLSHDLHTAADEHDMAYETARTHLKSIFGKTGIHRQGELVSFLSRIAFHVNLRDRISRSVSQASV